MKIAAIVVAALACASLAGAEEPAKKGEIAVKADAGSVAVTVTRYDPERCTLTVESKDGTLRLKAESKPGLEKGCEAGFSVTAPAAAGPGLIDFDGVSRRASLVMGRL